MRTLRVKKKISRASRSMGASANTELRRLLGSDVARDIQIRTGRRQGVLGPGRKPNFPPMPVTWFGTLPEWAVYWAHLAIGLKEEQDFAYLYSLGDMANQVDFFEFDLQMVIEIQGLYWHYGLGAAKQLNDLERKIRIESLGITVIFIDEDHALMDPIYFLREARTGIDHSRAGKDLI